jgi:hypothetical protein
MVILYTLWRMRKRVAVDESAKSNFQPLNAGRTSSLQTAEQGTLSAALRRREPRSIREVTGG